MMDSRTDTATALRAVHLHEQYFDDFLNLKALRESVFRGRGRVGGEYTAPVAMV